MKAIDQERFTGLLRQERIKPRLVRELRFVPNEIHDWEERELLAVTTRSGNEGVLLASIERFYVLPYRLSKSITNTQTGRSTPITCDFCYTWQRGGNAGNISFVRPSDEHIITFLCCGDLECSLNVRDMTNAAALSRTQLHEDMTTEQRIERLQSKFKQIIDIIGGIPIEEL